MREVLAEQARAGIDLVSDGQVRWHDPVSHVMNRLGAVDSAGLRRYFDTGMLYLRPRVNRRLAGGHPLMAEEMKWARAVSMRPVVASLPGPLTLSRLSSMRGGPYSHPDELARAIVPLLAEEVERLASAGVAAVVLEEPSLLREPEALPLVADAVEVLAARKGKVRLWLFPSLGDAGSLFGNLQELALDGLLLDLCRGPGLAEAIKSAGTQLCLGLGLVRSDSVRPESAAELAGLVARLLRKVGGNEVWLCPAGGLEGLPRSNAREKLLLLAKVRDLVLGKRTGKDGQGPRPTRARKAAKRRFKRNRLRKTGRKKASGRRKKNSAASRRRR